MGKRLSRQCTLRIVAKRLQQVRGLADRALGLLKHVEEETHLAEQAVLVNARRRGMVQGEVPYYWSEVKELEERIRIRVRDVDLEPGILGFVVIPGVVSIRAWTVSGTG